MNLLEHLLKDASVQCSTVYDPRDFDTIRKRVSSEGWSFVTITLPGYLKALHKCLENGRIVSQDFVGWRKTEGLPCFLQGFLKLIFCGERKLIEDSDQSIYAIRAIRQVCSFFKKEKRMCSDERVKDALINFCQIDDDMRVSLEDSCSTELFQDVSAYVVSSVFKDFQSENLVPKHGPGATADRLNGNQKFVQSKIAWPKQLDSLVNRDLFLYNTEESCYLDTEDVKTVEPYALPSRLSCVPKTAETPRVIALEPTAMQMVQQPLKDYLVKSIEGAPLTKGHVNFSDQTINRRLALENSRSREYATVDLSAASDRVSKEQIYLLFSVYPELRSALFSARSNFIDISGSIRELNKFASMGSALCFPCEAIYFFVLCICSILENRKLPASPSNISNIAKRVYVYGDDIIVPSTEVDYLIKFMAKFKARVGAEKSFSKGFFRESCGMDAYNGVDITPVYNRRSILSSRRDVPCAVSNVSTVNQLHAAGYIQTALYFKELIEIHLGKLPSVEETCAGLGWHFGNYASKSRVSKQLQRKEVRTLVVDVLPNSDPLSGYAALQKCLLRLENPMELDTSYPISYRRRAQYFKDVQDKKHLRRSFGFGTLTLKSRWIALR